MRTWIIDVLKCPRTNAVRYAGRTAKTPEARLRAHITDGGNGIAGWGAPEQPSERTGKAPAGQTPQQRRANALKAGSMRSPGERSLTAKKRIAAKTLQEFTTQTKRAGECRTPEQMRASAEKMNAGLTQVERSVAAKKGQAGLSPGQPGAASRHAAGFQTGEPRRNAGIAGAASRRRVKS
jgi:hypothetical protein